MQWIIIVYSIVHWKHVFLKIYVNLETQMHNNKVIRSYVYCTVFTGSLIPVLHHGVSF